MITILFMPKMSCNLTCAYCHFEFYQGGWKGYGKDHAVTGELSWEEWLKGFERFRPYHLEFTGGEPLSYSGFKSLIRELPADCRWAITSNTLLDVSNIQFDKCIHWTASHHGFQPERFEMNIEYLRGKVPLSISLVVPFDDVEATLARAVELKKKNVQVNLLRELNPGVNWEGTPQWDRVLSMRGYYGMNVVEDDIPANYEFERGFYCKAGTSKYFCAMPDGSVYSCYSQAMSGDPMGHISDVKLHPYGWDCWHECKACALDFKFRVRKLRCPQTAA